ncbi:type IV pilus secretin PilQ [Neisseria gonorrhoeae]
MNTKLTKIISGLFVATAAFQTASAGNITDIKVSSLPNKQKIVKVSFDKEIVNPTGFVTSSPARIALDFEQTGISMDQQVLEYADPLLSKISAAQNSSRARLVLNLNKPGQYNTEVRGNKVWIFINESDDTVSAPARPAVKAAPAAPAKQQAAAPFTESVVSVSAPFSPAKQQAAASAKQQAATPAKQTNIDFRKDGKNAGIIELAALGFAGQPDISQQHDHIIVTLKNHTLPTALQRSLDVADFKTPVQKVTLKRLNQGNIVNIAPRDELLAKDKAFLQAEKDIADLGALYSQNFQLKYKNVEEFRSILRLDNADTTGNRNTLVSGRGSVLIDPATNTLIVTDTRSVIEKFRKLIDELDVPAQQVMIEARIVEAADGFSRDLGVKFGATGRKKLKNETSAFGWGVNSGFGGGDKWEAQTKINLPVAAAANSISLVRAISSGALNLELSASESLSKTKTLANPRVLTQNRKEAKIESGYEIPFTVTTASGGGNSTNTELKKAVLGLTVTPNITPDGQIIMTVKINKDSPAQCASGSNTILCISTKSLNTQAMVENGGTLIVGGIYEENNGNTLTKVPLLGDIPVIGNLFKTRGKKTDRRELLIFITPRIIDTAGNSLRY